MLNQDSRLIIGFYLFVLVTVFIHEYLRGIVSPAESRVGLSMGLGVIWIGVAWWMIGQLTRLYGKSWKKMLPRQQRTMVIMHLVVALGIYLLLQGIIQLAA